MEIDHLGLLVFVVTGPGALTGAGATAVPEAPIAVIGDVMVRARNMPKAITPPLLISRMGFSSNKRINSKIKICYHI
jgi:hypothetical protein